MCFSQRKHELLQLLSLDSRSWCFKKHPSHPPAPSLHLKCHECSSKPTGIGKIAAQQQLCDTMVMVATENPSLGGGRAVPERAARLLPAKFRFFHLWFFPLPWFRRALSNSCLLTASARCPTPQRWDKCVVEKPRSHNQYFTGSALAGLR